ncbi:MAG: DUF1015 domain-containing protein [Ruminococcaceae bacterium]|nr:DUF1015 domain-containing protein [Oscillospiraceae bacterium]
MKNLIFSPADFCLPDYAPTDPAWTKWAVIACDQFTSEISYWEEAARIVDGAPSALRLILPEAYLGSAQEEVHKQTVAAAMQTLDGTLRVWEDSMLYLERTLPDGRIRRGLVGKIDLEAYDYNAGSSSAVRATEATVLERIPPRVAIRSAADYELPHVMVLIDDTDGIFAHLAAARGAYTKLYDFDLMLGGGHAAGWRIAGEALESVTAKIAAYEAARAGDLVYAMGDGNHSLASARAHYMNLKEKMGDTALQHPARWALVELVALSDPALDFEPIYRVVTDCDPADFLGALAQVTADGGEGDQHVQIVTASEEREVSFTTPAHALTVGTLQEFIDAYIDAHPGVKCDYIHDESSLIALAKRDGCVGFLFDGMAKEELFPYVRAHGTLPRKTFSMGEARSKRYYIEARKIVE